MLEHEQTNGRECIPLQVQVCRVIEENTQRGSLNGVHVEYRAVAQNILKLCREYHFGSRIGELTRMMRDALMITFQHESRREERIDDALCAILDSLPVSIDGTRSIQGEA